MAIPFSILSRQSSLGPPSELGEFFPEEPFPLEELSRGLATGGGKGGESPTPTEVPVGLKAASSFGQILSLPDDDFIKQGQANLDFAMQEATTQIMKDPRNALNPQIVSQVRGKKASHLENVKRVKNNKAQYDLLNKTITGGKYNPHDLIEVDRELRRYEAAWRANPEVVPELNIDTFIARAEVKKDRDKIINDNVGKVKAKGAVSDSDLENARNASIQNIDGERVLVSVTGERIPSSSVSVALEEVFQQPGFMEDVTRQAEYDLELSGTIGDEGAIDSKVNEILDGHRRRSLATFPGGRLEAIFKGFKRGQGVYVEYRWRSQK